MPDFEAPPVVEIIAAVQGAPLVDSGFDELVRMASQDVGWKLSAEPALPPIVERPTPTLHAMPQFEIGAPPMRLIAEAPDGGWAAQYQRDRLVVHERKQQVRPSFSRVAPALQERVGRMPATPWIPELVELVYDNWIEFGTADWQSWSEVGAVLRPFGDVGRLGDGLEQASISATLPLSNASGAFAGRLHFAAGPAQAPRADAPSGLTVRIISRRYVADSTPELVLADCHADIVYAFARVTSDKMQKHWGRLR